MGGILLDPSVFRQAEPSKVEMPYTWKSRRLIESSLVGRYFVYVLHAYRMIRQHCFLALRRRLNQSLSGVQLFTHLSLEHPPKA